MNVPKQSQRRILRNYRNLAPSKFHAFNQRVRQALADNSKFPESIWAGNPTLMSSYLSASDQHDQVFHDATYGSRIDIAKRELLQAQIVDYLDELAALLEGAAVRIPDLLISSGFELAKEQRGHARAKAAPIASEDINASNAVHPPSE